MYYKFSNIESVEPGQERIVFKLETLAAVFLDMVVSDRRDWSRDLFEQEFRDASMEFLSDHDIENKAIAHRFLAELTPILWDVYKECVPGVSFQLSSKKLMCLYQEHQELRNSKSMGQ